MQFFVRLSLVAMVTVTCQCARPGVQEEVNPAMIKYKTNCNPKYYIQPRCVDNPDVYTCKCGAGYYWNTKICVAEGIDSYLVFNDTNSVPYTQLMSKTFHQKHAFTITMWLNVQSQDPGTVLSYSDKESIYIRIITNQTLHFQLFDKWYISFIKINISKPFHLAWSWSNSNGYSHIVIDGGRANITAIFPESKQKVVPEGKDLILGQTPDDLEQQIFKYSFKGALSFVNIWDSVLDKADIRAIFEDCMMMQCGSDVQWSDFRTGTRGAMQILWPTGLFKMSSCFTQKNLTISCDNFCNDLNGAQCKKETVKNVIWEKTFVAHNNVSRVPCFGQNGQASNSTPSAIRECVFGGPNTGKWLEPNLNACIPLDKLQLRSKVERLMTKYTEKSIFDLLYDIRNMTRHEQYNNIFELASVIETLQLLIRVQNMLTMKPESGKYVYLFGLNRTYDSSAYPSFHQIKQFVETSLEIMNELANPDKNTAWQSTQPQGAEGDKLFEVIEELARLATSSVHVLVRRGDMDPISAQIIAQYEFMSLYISSHKLTRVTDITFPSTEVVETDSRTRHDVVKERVKVVGSIVLSPEQIIRYSSPQQLKSEFFTFALGKFHTPFLLPNHTAKRRSKENNVNSAIYLATLFPDELFNSAMTSAIKIRTKYLDNNNISNPICANLQHGKGPVSWQWDDSTCILADNGTEWVTCNCTQPGIFTVITDMYDLNWKPPEERAILLDIPSYIGCSVSAMLCFLAFVMLIYLRTSSPMAAVHKNFAIAIMFSQLAFMFGIDKYESQMVCQIFAICLHYFILSSFSWLMNETVSLYTVIVYAAQSKGEHMEGGSNLRYYILGWVFPGVLVGAFVGVHAHEYYAPDMCSINFNHKWLFLGPILGLIAVTLLVLVFIAKEHAESAYTNSEKTNKMLIIHSRALWTQVILLTICWAFAVLTLRMSGIIIKVLYGLFNCAQGAFFFVFYFLLNDEVRKFYKARTSKRTGGEEEDEYQSSDAEYAEEMQELTMRVPADVDSNVPPAGVVRQRERSVPQPPRDAHADDNDGSDCEMMVTTV